MPRKVLTALSVVLAITLLEGMAIAGGPFVVDMVNRTGVAQRWENDKMVWCVDEGKLSDSVDNATAVGWINSALNRWTSVTLKYDNFNEVSTAAIQTEIDTTCDVGDIDITNFEDHAYTTDGPSVIIFDDTGDIVAELYGEQNRNTTVGLSQPLASDASGLHITKGVAIFNGLLLDNGALAPTQEASEDLFKATVLHELGHMLNMDHSQVNFDIASDCVRNGPCANAEAIPTMYPELMTPMQGYGLHRDDMVTISWIYPTSDFQSKFCTITGEIFDGDGEPLKGVNVIAKNTQSDDTSRVDARAFVTGVLKPTCYGDSRYYLHGLKPNVQYKVEYEAIGEGFIGASDFEPLDNPPSGFASGIIESPSGETTVYCTEGGQTIEMASVTIDTPNPCAGFQDNSSNDAETSSSAKKCSLTRSVGGDISVGMLVILMSILIVSRRRRTSPERVS